MEKLDVDGQWWLPGNEKNPVAGHLSISPEGRVELTLIGALDSYLSAGDSSTEDGVTTTHITEDSMDRSGVYQRVLGVADNRAFTLEDNLQVHRQMIGLESQRIQASQAFRNVHFEGGEPLQFKKVMTDMDWLAFWVGQSGINETHEFVKDDDGSDQHKSITVTVSRVPPQSCPGPKGSVVTLAHGYGIDGNRVTERRLTQDFGFAVEMPTLVPIGELLDQMSDLQDLVSIGTGQIAAYSGVQFFHPNVVHSLPDKDFNVAIDMFARWQVVNERPVKSLNYHEMYFTLGELGGIAGVARWLQVAAANRTALGRVLSTRYSRGMYQSDKMFNCAAALEGYDRDKNPKGTLAERLRRLAKQAGTPFQTLVGDVGAWVEKLKDARNDAGHHKARLFAASTEHLFLSESAYWLFVLCLLKEAQAPQAVFDHIGTHAHYRWLQRRVAEMLNSTPSTPEIFSESLGLASFLHPYPRARHRDRSYLRSPVDPLCRPAPAPRNGAGVASRRDGDRRGAVQAARANIPGVQGGRSCD